MNILKGQYTENKPYLIDNYPYGFKKTMARAWVESVQNKGDRFCLQTQNPKTQVWNKPKKSTYSGVIVLYLNDKGQVKQYGLYPSTDKGEYDEFINNVNGDKGDFPFNSVQESCLKWMRSAIKVYSQVSYSVGNAEKTEEEREKHNKDQKEIQDKINKSIQVEYLKN